MTLATNAPRRMIRRAPLPTPSRLWRAASLYWRRRRARAVATGRRPQPVRRITVCQSHLHIHLVASAARVYWRETRRDSATRVEQIIGVAPRQARPAAVRAAASVTTRWLARVAPPSSRSSASDIRALRQARSMSAWPMRSVLAMAGLAPTAATGVAARPEGDSRVHLARPKASGLMPQASTEWRRAVRSRPHSTVAPVSPEMGSASAAIRAEHPARHRRSVQPPPIVWRASAPPRRGGHERPAPSAPTPTASVTSATPPPSGDVTSAHSATGHARTAGLRLVDFDPGVLDRLTEDVIQRVERRIRIERERRGL